MSNPVAPAIPVNPSAPPIAPPPALPFRPPAAPSWGGGLGAGLDAYLPPAIKDPFSQQNRDIANFYKKLPAAVWDWARDKVQNWLPTDSPLFLDPPGASSPLAAPMRPPKFEGGQDATARYQFEVQFKPAPDRDWQTAIIGGASGIPGIIQDLNLKLNSNINITYYREGFPTVEGTGRNGSFTLVVTTPSQTYNLTFGYTGNWEVGQAKFIKIIRMDAKPDTSMPPIGGQSSGVGGLGAGAAGISRGAGAGASAAPVGSAGLGAGVGSPPLAFRPVPGFAPPTTLPPTAPNPPLQPTAPPTTLPPPGSAANPPVLAPPPALPGIGLPSAPSDPFRDVKDGSKGKSGLEPEPEPEPAKLIPPLPPCLPTLGICQNPCDRQDDSAPPESDNPYLEGSFEGKSSCEEDEYVTWDWSGDGLEGFQSAMVALNERLLSLENLICSKELIFAPPQMWEVKRQFASAQYQLLMRSREKQGLRYAWRTFYLPNPLPEYSGREFPSWRAGKFRTVARFSDGRKIEICAINIEEGRTVLESLLLHTRYEEKPLISVVEESKEIQEILYDPYLVRYKQPNMDYGEYVWEVKLANLRPNPNVPRGV